MAGGSKALEKQIAALKRMEGFQVEAGWFETDRYKSKKGGAAGESVARIARINEYGYSRETEDGKKVVIPPRPFMRLAWTMFSQQRNVYQNVIARKLIRNEISPEQALNQIGFALVGNILKSIKDGNWVRNAPSTIKKKGFDSPLTDTGHMAQSVNHKVTKE